MVLSASATPSACWSGAAASCRRPRRQWWLTSGRSAARITRPARAFPRSSHRPGWLAFDDPGQPHCAHIARAGIGYLADHPGAVVKRGVTGFLEESVTDFL